MGDSHRNERSCRPIRGGEEARLHAGRHPSEPPTTADRRGRVPGGVPRGGSSDLTRAFLHLSLRGTATGMSAILSPLSAEQAAAAHAGPDGAFLIAAGPGTGKTFTATERSGLRFVLKLKGRGIRPDQFQQRATELHGINWASPDAAGGERAARAELEAIEVLSLIYRTYEDALRDGGLRDFDDLILAVIDALQRVPEFRARCRERFRYLLVDEFQDTNRIQLDLIRLLSADDFGNVSAVGDAKQSIYGWRDAEIENIRTRFGGRRLPLTHNRRSFQEILDCATDFIRRDSDFSTEPDLVATRGSGGAPVTIVMAPDSRSEARTVAETIRRLHRSGRRLSDIAILPHSVRMLPRAFDAELRRPGLPY